MPRKRKGLDDEALFRAIHSGGKKYVSYEEGAKLYSVGRNSFIELAHDARAVRNIKGRVIVNIAIVDEYIEIMGSTI